MKIYSLGLASSLFYLASANEFQNPDDQESSPSTETENSWQESDPNSPYRESLRNYCDANFIKSEDTHYNKWHCSKIIYHACKKFSDWSEEHQEHPFPDCEDLAPEEQYVCIEKCVYWTRKIWGAYIDLVPYEDVNNVDSEEDSSNDDSSDGAMEDSGPIVGDPDLNDLSLSSTRNSSGSDADEPVYPEWNDVEPFLKSVDCKNFCTRHEKWVDKYICYDKCMKLIANKDCELEDWECFKAHILAIEDKLPPSDEEKQAAAEAKAAELAAQQKADAEGEPFKPEIKTVPVLGCEFYMTDADRREYCKNRCDAGELTAPLKVCVKDCIKKSYYFENQYAKKIADKCDHCCKYDKGTEEEKACYEDCAWDHMSLNYVIEEPNQPSDDSQNDTAEPTDSDGFGDLTGVSAGEDQADAQSNDSQVTVADGSTETKLTVISTQPAPVWTKQRKYWCEKQCYPHFTYGSPAFNDCMQQCVEYTYADDCVNKCFHGTSTASAADKCILANCKNNFHPVPPKPDCDPKYEEAVKCFHPCMNWNCKDYLLGIPQTCPVDAQDNCKPGCMCKQPYVFCEQSQSCITREQCEAKKYQIPDCQCFMQKDCPCNGEVVVPDERECKDVNMQWSACGPAEPATCFSAPHYPPWGYAYGQDCVADCFCVEGYVLHNGVCIPFEDCPEEPPVEPEKGGGSGLIVGSVIDVYDPANCPENTVHVECYNQCWNEYARECYNKVHGVVVDCPDEIPPEKCSPGCHCAKGFVWCKKSQSCITKEKCLAKFADDTVDDTVIFEDFGDDAVNPPPKPDEEDEVIKLCKGEFEIWVKHASLPEPTCKDPNPIPQASTLGKCVCQPGFVRDRHGNCIPEEECPSLDPIDFDIIDIEPFPCKKNMVPVKCFSECEHREKISCKYFMNSYDVTCLEIPPEECRFGCTCAAGYVWCGVSQSCMTIADCKQKWWEIYGKDEDDLDLTGGLYDSEIDVVEPQECKDPNAEWNDCPKPYARNCKNWWFYENMKQPNVCGRPRCDCIQPYVFNPDGVCVLPEDCKKFEIVNP